MHTSHLFIGLPALHPFFVCNLRLRSGFGTSIRLQFLGLLYGQSHEQQAELCQLGAGENLSRSMWVGLLSVWHEACLFSPLSS